MNMLHKGTVATLHTTRIDRQRPPATGAGRSGTLMKYQGWEETNQTKTMISSAETCPIPCRKKKLRKSR
jgi:hypothetical protein